MKISSSYSPVLLTYKINKIDNPEKTANIFNSYFRTIAEKTQAKIKHSNKSATNKEEIKIILSCLDINKSTRTYSFPSKVLKMLKNDISEQLTDLFNLSLPI